MRSQGYPVPAPEVKKSKAGKAWKIVKTVFKVLFALVVLGAFLFIGTRLYNAFSGVAADGVGGFFEWIGEAFVGLF